MNRFMVFHTTGRILLAEALLLLLPACVSLWYGEDAVWAFLITAGIALAVGLALFLIFRPKDTVIYAKEGFAIVALVWIGMSLVGALPFYITGQIPRFADAFFETVSGFTTTGASILENVEDMSRGLLFWRSFTHWLGGMGVLVFVMALLPNVTDRSIHIMRAEMPGPVVGKLVPKVRDTAKILYLIYIGLTTLEIVFLLAGGMPLFDSAVHAFGTAGTGGFGIRADSLGGYSPYLQWVVAIFMLLFGINFNLFYLMLIRRFKTALRSEEMWIYFGLAGTAAVLILCNIYSLYGNFAEALRHSVFQTASILTTTGYSTVDFNLWPGLARTVLLLLMFVGGCAGSTAGGIKVSRIILMLKMIFREVRQMVRPRSVNPVRFEGKTVEENTLKSVSAYFLIYLICFFSAFLLISWEPFDFETKFTAVVACFNNIGPGFGAVGPAANFAGFSTFSKYVLSSAMLLGRLEIFPLLIAFSPSTWFRK